MSRNKQKISSIISLGLNIIGNLISEGIVEIEGSIEGNVTCNQVTVHSGGLITGDIFAETVYVSGEVQGTIKCKSIKLKKSAKVKGFIEYESISIETGASVDGQCKIVLQTDKNSYREIIDSNTSKLLSEAGNDERQLATEEL